MTKSRLNIQLYAMFVLYLTWFKNDSPRWRQATDLETDTTREGYPIGIQRGPCQGTSRKGVSLEKRAPSQQGSFLMPTIQGEEQSTPLRVHAERNHLKLTAFRETLGLHGAFLPPRTLHYISLVWWSVMPCTAFLFRSYWRKHQLVQNGVPSPPPPPPTHTHTYTLTSEINIRRAGRPMPLSAPPWLKIMPERKHAPWFCSVKTTQVHRDKGGQWLALS